MVEREGSMSEVSRAFADVDWWVYENWTVVVGGKARVHHGECSFCDHGRGIHSYDSGRNSRWHGPYPSMDAAMTKAISLGRIDTRLCTYCERKYVILKR